MPDELSVTGFRAIQDDRDRLIEETRHQRERIVALEKEARRAASLERELERERGRHTKTKGKLADAHQAVERAEETLSALRVECRDQADYIDHQRELIEKSAGHLERAQKAEKENVFFSKEAQRLASRNADLHAKLAEAQGQADKYVALKEALK